VANARTSYNFLNHVNQHLHRGDSTGAPLSKLYRLTLQVIPVYTGRNVQRFRFMSKSHIYVTALF
jgi:hypothetical protein